MIFVNPMGHLIAAQSWESLLVFFLFIIVSAVANWLQRKGEAAKPDPLSGEPEPLPPGSPPAFPRRARPWEQPDRADLEKGAPPPPVFSSPARPKPPAPSPLPAPSLSPLLPRKAEVATVPATRQPAKDSDLAGAFSLSQERFGESLTPYEKASQLSDQIAQRFRDLDARLVHPRPAAPARSRAEAVSRQTLLGTERTYWRQAMIASILLGPPPGLSSHPESQAGLAQGRQAP